MLFVAGNHAYYRYVLRENPEPGQREANVEKAREAFCRALRMMRVPEDLMGGCTEGELAEQKEDAVTREAYELITHTDSIKAVFAGHMHYDFVSELTPTLKQYIVNVDSGNIVNVQ